MKKKMKQLTALGLAMMLGFTGCAGQREDSGEKNQQGTIQVEEITEPTPAEEEKAEAMPLKIHVVQNHKNYYAEDAETNYFYLQYSDVTVEGSDYEKLKYNLEKWSMDRSTVLREQAEELAASAAEEVKEDTDFYGYSLYQTLSVARADSRVVSLLEDNYQYTGGAHGNSYREGVTFDAVTGKRLALKDILTDYENFTVEATERIIAELQKTDPGELFENYEENIEALWQEGQEPEWYLDASGLVIVLQEYCVGPYTMGKPEIHLPYGEFEYYIKENYIARMPEGVAALEKNQELYLQLPGRSDPLPMMLKYEWKEEMPECSLWLGKNKQQISEFATLEKAFLIRSGDEIFCMVEIDMASDDYVTYIYRLTEGVIQEVDRIGAAIDAGNINSEGVVMESWVYLLGTYGGIKNYTFDVYEGFTTEDTEYILERNEAVLTTKAELPVMLDGVESTLPVGSRIVLNATDGDTYVKFTIQGTGQTGVMEVTREENSSEVTIHGISEYECFEDLPYAG